MNKTQKTKVERVRMRVSPQQVNRLSVWYVGYCESHRGMSALPMDFETALRLLLDVMGA